MSFLKIGFFMTLLFSISSWGSDQPSIEVNIGGPELKLGSIISENLKRFPKFQILQEKEFDPLVLGLFDDDSPELPMATVGDYNLDGIKDLVVMLKYYSERGRYVVLAMMFVSQRRNHPERGQSHDYLAYSVYSEPLQKAYKEPLLKGYTTYLVPGTMSAKEKLTGNRAGPDILSVETLGAPTTRWFGYRNKKIFEIDNKK